MKTVILVPVRLPFYQYPQSFLIFFDFLLDEILLSSDKTIAIIDGSGVLADPAGLNREELIRLAKLRVPVGNFDLSKLSKDGYLVKVEDQDFKLPCKPFIAYFIPSRADRPVSSWGSDS